MTQHHLLVQIDKEQVKTIYQHVENDSLVIIDEVQDFFPSDRAKLSPEMTEFVTQHGHRGLDIILMGQDYRDTHTLWKRRIDQLYQFTKQDAIGRPGHYTWASFKFKGDKPVKLNSGTGKYEEKYFGLYKSHTDGTENKDTYNDDRANVLKSPMVKYGVPAAMLAGFYAVYFLWGMFHGDRSMVKTDSLPQQQAEVKQANPQAVQSQPVEGAKPIKKAIGHAEYLDSLLSQYKPRLGGVIHAIKDGKRKMVGRVEFIDDTMHVKEALTFEQIESLGWVYGLRSYGVELKKGMQSVVVTAWPIDVYGKVPQDTSQRLNSQESARVTGKKVETAS